MPHSTMESADKILMQKAQLKFAGALLVVSVLLGFNNCGKSIGGNSQYLPTVNIVSNGPPLGITGGESYVTTLTVGCGYINEPCVTVVVCQPGTNNCVSINNVLLDTGSYGLRVFSSVIAGLGLSPIQDSSGHSIAECQGYADGSSDWGPVVRGDIMINGETASNIPIQSIDSSWGSVPSDCTGLDTDPGSAGFNGILGVGHFVYDCGGSCAASSNNRVYFDCDSTSTTCDTQSIAVPLRNQVMNPVAAFPTDNNGVILQFPNISPYGATGAEGWLVFGIGTQADNAPPSGVVTFPADTGTGNFITAFNSVSYSSFIDSGSNGLFFPTPSGLTVCSDATGFFCPGSAYISSGVQTGASGTPTQSIQFEIQDADIALSSSSPYVAFNNLGGPFSNQFDWGLPFFFGRTIYVGIEQTSSPLGKGPYWAY